MDRFKNYFIEMSGTSEKKRILKTEVNDLQQTYDDMEYRFAIGKISQEIFDKHGPKLKTQIDEKSKQLLNLPSKKSNHQKFLKKFLKIAENPGEFYESLNYNDKRVFQNIVFPKGFMFSLKSKECRTSKMNMIFDLTNSFKDAYNVEIKKTQIQKVLESRLVDNCIEISNISFNQRDFELTNYLIKKLVSKDYL